MIMRQKKKLVIKELCAMDYKWILLLEIDLNALFELKIMLIDFSTNFLFIYIKS